MDGPVVFDANKDSELILLEGWTTNMKGASMY